MIERRGGRGWTTAVAHDRDRMKASSSSTQTSRKEPWANIDEYLASLPADQRVVLQALRKAISAAAPGAEEGVSYGLPAFRLKGRPLVCFAAASHHCSLYPMSPAVIRAHADNLKKYEISKGTIRFTAPLPSALVRKLVKARVAELESK
jgi:uncharacterized protein YdhG (YjbR/CyaY superfamily)